MGKFRALNDAKRAERAARQDDSSAGRLVVCVGFHGSGMMLCLLCPPPRSPTVAGLIKLTTMQLTQASRSWLQSCKARATCLSGTKKTARQQRQRYTRQCERWRAAPRLSRTGAARAGHRLCTKQSALVSERAIRLTKDIT